MAVELSLSQCQCKQSVLPFQMFTIACSFKKNNPDLGILHQVKFTVNKKFICV